MSETSSQTAPYTVSDLVSLALRQLGVGAQGTTPGAVDLADGLMHLNLMLQQWQRRRWLVPNLVEVLAPALGNVSDLVGPGQTFDIENRPDSLEAAFCRYVGTPGDFTTEFSATDFVVGGSGMWLDFPLTILRSYEDYARIGIKQVGSFPVCVFYSPEYPYGRVSVWPIPNAGNWETHLVFKQPIVSALDSSSEIALPPEYQDAIMWNLALRMAPSYGAVLGSGVVEQIRPFAAASLNNVRLANRSMPLLQLPGALANHGGGVAPQAIAAGWF